MHELTAIECRQVNVAYDDNLALEHISLQISAGEFVGVVGPNGAGKSTLLNAMLGLAPLTHGEIKVHGLPAKQVRKRIAYMPQREAIDWSFPVTVEDVVLMGRWPQLGWFRRVGRTDREVAIQALAQVQMADLRGRPIGQLSGGQQQRVFLARALAQEGDVLLLDEPMTGVDATTQEVILQLLQNLRQRGRTIIMTTHDLGVARAFCTQLLFLNRRLMAYGPPSKTFTPEVLQQTYGGHVLRVKDQGATAETLEDALLILRDDTCHGCSDPLLDDVSPLPHRHG